MRSASPRQPKSLTSLSRSVAANEIEIGSTSEESGKVKFDRQHTAKTKPAGTVDPMNLPKFVGHNCPDVGNGSGGPL